MSTDPLNDIRLVELLGEGGAGEVWRAVRGPQQEAVAVKLISGPDAASPKVRRLFMHELRATAALDHSGVIDIYDHGPASAALVAPTQGRVVPGAPALVMELLPGGALTHWRPELRFGVVLELLEEILGALAHAHARGVLHRDIKPDNILLDAERRPRLVDFGLAWVREEENPIENQVLGTPGYVAPEQIGHTGILPSPATDLYSLACTAWALTTGAPPFGRGREVVSVLYDHRSTEPPEYLPRAEVPAWFEVWLRRCLQKDPRARFRDAPAALSALGPSPRPPRLAPPRPRSLADRPDPSPRLLGLRSPLLGRDQEKQTLWETLLDVREERTAKVVRVEGAHGMGKSQLLGWLGAAAAETGVAEVVVVRGDERGGELLDAITQHLGPEAKDRSVLAYALGVTAQDPWLGALWALLGGHTMGGRANRTSLVAWALARLGHDRPTLLLLDGAQSTDATQLLEMLAHHPALGPVMAVLAAPAGLVPPLDESETTITLAPIPPAQLRPLLDRLVRLEGPLAAQVANRCGGSPLLALSLLASWTEHGALRQGANGWALERGADRHLPTNLAALPRQRIEDVVSAATEESDIALEALELAAVLGVEVDGGAWRAALDFVDLVVPDAAVEALLDRGLITAGRTVDEWRFAHGLLREALLTRARDGGRSARWHSVTAAILAAREGDAAAERCGQHLLAAGRPDEAATPLLVGAEHRQDRGDIEYALSLLNAAEAALNEGRVPEADQRWGRLWIARSILELDRRGPDASEQWASKALEVSRRHPWRHIAARAMYQLGRAALNRGDGPATERLLSEAAERAAELEDPWLLGRCYRELGARRSETGKYETAAELLEAAAEELEDDPDPASQGYAFVLLAANSIRQLDGDAAAAWAAKAGPRFELGGSVRGLAIAQNIQGEVARIRGDLQGARDAYEEAASLHRRSGSSMEWFAYSNLGLLEAVDGDPAVGRGLLEECIAGFLAAGRGGYIVHPRVYLLAALAGVKDWTALRDALGDAMESVEATRTKGDPDMVRAVQVAGERATAGGQQWLAEQCRQLLAEVES
ncbi:MAG: protein kinase [Deltaproteobacteria bacterium]|nr:protein kinase [Deltaproteobacteria bacterium]